MVRLNVATLESIVTTRLAALVERPLEKSPKHEKGLPLSRAGPSNMLDID